LREKFGFEIVSEQEDGYVIVASEDRFFRSKVRGRSFLGVLPGRRSGVIISV
jgi:hypothetical protein